MDDDACWTILRDFSNGPIAQMEAGHKHPIDSFEMLDIQLHFAQRRGNVGIALEWTGEGAWSAMLEIGILEF